jgi:hypothetical protein
MKNLIILLIIAFNFSCNNLPPFQEKERKEKEKEKTNSCLILILFYTNCINSQPNNFTDRQKESNCGGPQNAVSGPCVTTSF